MSKKLLIADDSITIQKVMTITFSSKDYELVIVGNGIDAISKAKDVKPDLVLADIGMPGKNGYEVCEAIKKTPELKDIPVLLLAGAFEPFDANKVKAVGADDYIMKPFETQALINKVNELLSRAKKPEVAAEAGVSDEIEDALDIDLGEIIEEETEGIELTEEAKTAEETSPEDIWSMEGFDGAEKKAEIPKAVKTEERPQVTAKTIAAEVMAEEAEPEEAIEIGEFTEETGDSGVGVAEETFTALEINEVTGEAETVDAETEEHFEQIPIAEAVESPVHAKNIAPPASISQISLEIQKQVSEILIKTLPSLMQKIAEEIINSVIKGFVKDAIDKGNILEKTKRMVDEEFKKVK